MTTDWMTGADPSWFPRVLRVLQRDYPAIADAVWGTAIGENAERLASCGHEVARFECAARTARPEAGPVIAPGAHKVIHFRWSHETGEGDAACSCGATGTGEAGLLAILRCGDNATAAYAAGDDWPRGG